MEKTLKSFKELAQTARKTAGYFVQGAILDFTEDIVSRMETQAITKSDLANKLNTSPAYITKLLGGDNNFTLETMVKMALAVDSELRIHLQPKGCVSQWIDMLESQSISTPDMEPTNLYLSKAPTLSPNRFATSKAANEDLALAA